MTLRLTEPTAVPAGGYPETRMLLESAGLTPKQAEAAARNWPPDAAREAIRTTRTANNPAAALAARVKKVPPAPASQRGAVDGTGGSTTGEGLPGTYRACRWPRSKREQATQALLLMHQGDPTAYDRFYRRVRPMIPCQPDAVVLNHMPVFASFGPVLNLALDWEVIQLDSTAV